MTHLGERPGYGQGALPFSPIPPPCGFALWDPDLSGRKSWRYSPECVEGEFSEVGSLTDSCWIHRCWLGCERGRALSRGSFPFPSGCSLPLPLFVHHPRRMRVLRTSH